ncbi:dipeptidase [Solirubrum puertoriconensis]|uniref:Membrane dipeptidase n=1 Tax=Solirubrum puertoriconensis TaxID=1751427 RepID=A0A9X0L4Y7_SOLP1|nr:dipeptidase [Solirubrum puertoriconensis]KUG08164.1 membrane dipeptidase [Solirubrum puertoriconensis]
MRLRLLFPFIAASALGTSAAAQQEAKARKLHEQIFTVDTHADTPMNLVKPGFDLTKDNDPTEAKLDFPKLKRGGLDAVFWAVYMGQGPRTPEGNTAAKQEALRIFDAIHAAIKAHPTEIAMATTPAEAVRIRKAGKRAIFIGIENGYPVGRDLGLLQQYYNLGARYMTLCHGTNNDLCDSATDPNGPEYQGLSPLGVQAVAEMNRLGMMVDISHTSDSTFYDVLRLSKAPVIASHSAARALSDVPRNLSDDMLRALARHDGVVQLNLFSPYVKAQPTNPARAAAVQAFNAKWKIKNFLNVYSLPEAEQKQALAEMDELDKRFPVPLATVQDAVNQIDHIVRVAGIDHVGIGGDFDGGTELDGLRDVGEYPNLTTELVRRGYSRRDIEKIWSGNLFRVMRAVERARTAAPATTAGK